MQNENNDGADAIRQPQVVSGAEAAILRELEESKRKSAELEETLQRVRVRKDGLKNGTWSPVRLHVMFRQYGTTFAALSRAIQGAMCPGTKVTYVANNHNSLGVCVQRTQKILEAYYGQTPEKENRERGTNYFKFLNGSSIFFVSRNDRRNLSWQEGLSCRESDRVIVDSVLSAEAMPEQMKNAATLDMLTMYMLSAKDPQIDIYISHEVKGQDCRFEPQLASPEYIKELLESRKDFGEGVKKGVIPWDLNRI